MKNYCEYFHGKKITVMGLGVLGRGVNVAKFFAECGADLTITDLKNEKELTSSLLKLKKFKNIKYVLGRHELSDFRNKDFIIKAASVPFDSSYIEEAQKNGAEIEMDASLFCKLAEGVIIVGVTGTKGKSTVSRLIFEILNARKNILEKKRNIFLAGNVRGLATLPLLKRAKNGDIVVLELDSWQLQGFNDAKISPYISVFINFMPDHMNYYKGDIKRYFEDKAAVFKYQKENDILVLGDNFLNNIKNLKLSDSLIDFKKQTRGKLVLASKKNIPKNWRFRTSGKHNLENIAAAISVCENLGIKKQEMKNTVQNFRGDPGRLEFIKEIKGVKFYNDTTATTPESALAALHAFQNYKGKIILLGGGADKNLDYKEYAKAVKRYVKALILFQGAASNKITRELGIKKTINLAVGLPSLGDEKSENKYSISRKSPGKFLFFSEIKSMKEAINLALENAEKNDIVLLSPGAASFGVFKNEFDRGEQFNKFVKKLK